MRLVLAVMLFWSATAWGSERCYELSAERSARAAGELCVDDSRAPDATLTIRSGSAKATLRVRLLTRVKCIDCNKDVFGSDGRDDLSLFSVRFDGTRAGGREQGTVEIAGQRFAYRVAGGSQDAEPPPTVSHAAGMKPERFNALLKSLEENSLSVSGTEGVIASAARDNHFSCEQVATVLKRLPPSFHDGMAKAMVPKIVDPENLSVVSEVLREDAQKYRGKPARR